MMWDMALITLLIVVALVLGVAALAKYISKHDR
jgi:hypothetical protein